MANAQCPVYKAAENRNKTKVAFRAHSKNIQEPMPEVMINTTDLGQPTYFAVYDIIYTGIFNDRAYNYWHEFGRVFHQTKYLCSKLSRSFS
jgi:hypothetical protein